MEAHDAAWLEPARTRLADVVQQRRDAQRHVDVRVGTTLALQVDGLLQHRQRMLVDVLVMMMLVDLEPHRRELRQEFVSEARVDHCPDATHGVRRLHRAHEFGLDPFGADDLEGVGERRDRIARALLDLEPELGREAAGAQHSQRIVAEADPGIVGRAQGAREKILDSARRVDELDLRHLQRHRIDREVASHEVALEVVAERDDRLAGLAVVAVGTVRRDLDLLALDPPDVPPGRRHGGHDPQDLVRVRVGREVEVVRGAPDERVAHRSADDRQFASGVGERASEDRDHGGSSEVAERSETGGHVEHDLQGNAGERASRHQTARRPRTWAGRMVTW